MANKEELQGIYILHQILRLSAEWHVTKTPLELLTQFLKKIYHVFSPEDEIASYTLQCFEAQKPGRLKRIENSPSIYNSFIYPQNKIPMNLKEIELFLAGAGYLENILSEPAGFIPNTFKEKLIVESI